MSIFETRFYRFLCLSTLPDHVRQFAVFDVLGTVARLDIAWPARRVGIEAHSLRWHSPRQRVIRDARRHNRLTALGWRMLYVTYEDLEERPEEILEKVTALLTDSL